MATTKRLLILLLLALLAATPAAPHLQAGSLTRQLALTELGAEPFAALQGPYSSQQVTFTLPPNWQPEEGSALTLDLQSFFSSFVPAQGELPQQNLVAGHISLRLDGAIMHRSVLSTNGDQQIVIPIDPALLASGPQHTLAIDWDASASCQFNLSSTVLVLPGSLLTLSYSETAIEPSLEKLPYPFFSTDALEHPGTLIVLPPNPTQGQVAAALTTAAALGRYAPEQSLELVLESALSEAQRQNHHLIYVGQVELFRSLQSSPLPHSQDATLRQPVSSRAELGFIEISRSPWNIQRAVLVVTGGSEAAVQRAALAVGGPLVLNERGSLAFVPQDSQPAVPPADTLASSFAQLGQTDFTFTRFGRSELRIPFYISPDRTVSDAAFLDLRFAHSQLLDYLRSSLTVQINGQALSTTRLVDQTAARHSEIALLPSTLLKPGINELLISAEVVPLDLCANPAEGDHWLTVYADSLISIPSANELQNGAVSLDLGQFPQPFLHNRMQDTALLLPTQDAQAWSNAAHLLRGLAASYQAWPLLPIVQVGSSSAAFANTNARNIILLGNFDDFLSDLEMQTYFAVKRSGESGELALSDGSRLGYSPTVPLAIASLHRLADNNVPSLALLGNSPESLQGLVVALTAPDFANHHNGALLLAQQNDTVIQDTRPAAASQPQVTAAAELVPTPSGLVSTGKSIWLWPLLALMLVAFGLVLWGQMAGWLRKRKAGN